VIDVRKPMALRKRRLRRRQPLIDAKVALSDIADDVFAVRDFLKMLITTKLMQLTHTHARALLILNADLLRSLAIYVFIIAH